MAYLNTIVAENSMANDGYSMIVYDRQVDRNYSHVPRSTLVLVDDVREDDDDDDVDAIDQSLPP